MEDKVGSKDILVLLGLGVAAMVRMTLRVVQALKKAGNVIAGNLPSLPKMLIGEVSNARRIMS